MASCTESNMSIYTRFERILQTEEIKGFYFIHRITNHHTYDVMTIYLMIMKMPNFTHAQ